MITYSGRQVFPSTSDHYTGQAPKISDIAIGLARQSRFGGQTRLFYSVLCHSIVGSELVDGEAKIHFLLHDAGESVLSDVVTTWKNELTRIDEYSIMALIYEEQGLEWPLSEAMQEAVKRADLACLKAEAHALGHAEADKWWPRDEWEDIDVEAFQLTIGMLQSMAPLKMLNSENAATMFEVLVARAYAGAKL